MIRLPLPLIALFALCTVLGCGGETEGRSKSNAAAAVGVDTGDDGVGDPGDDGGGGDGTEHDDDSMDDGLTDDTLADEAMAADPNDPSDPSDPSDASHSADPGEGTTVDAATSGPPWIVLSNFRKTAQGIASFGETWSVDYRWVSGRPNGPLTSTWVMKLTAPRGGIEEVKEYLQPVQLEPNGGTLQAGLEREIGPPSRAVTFVGSLRGPNDWNKISGDLNMGEQSSAPRPPNAGNQFAGRPVNDGVMPPGDPADPGDPGDGTNDDGGGARTPRAALNVAIPDAPSADKGSPQYAVQFFVIKLLKGDATGLDNVIHPDAIGDLGAFRDGTLAEDRLAELRRTLGAVKFSGGRTLPNGSRLLILENSDGQKIEFTVRRRRGDYVVTELSASPPRGNGNDGIRNDDADANLEP